MFREFCVWCLIVISVRSANYRPKTVWHPTKVTTTTTPPPIAPMSKSQLEVMTKSIWADLNSIAKIVNEEAEPASILSHDKHWSKDQEHRFVHRMNQDLEELKKKYEKYQDIALKFYPELFTTEGKFVEIFYTCKRKLMYGHKTYCDHCKRNLLA